MSHIWPLCAYGDSRRRASTEPLLQAGMGFHDDPKAAILHAAAFVCAFLQDDRALFLWVRCKQGRACSPVGFHGANRVGNVPFGLVSSGSWEVLRV